jgi:hypothetical protein
MYSVSHRFLRQIEGNGALLLVPTCTATARGHLCVAVSLFVAHIYPALPYLFSLICPGEYEPDERSVVDGLSSTAKAALDVIAKRRTVSLDPEHGKKDDHA